MKIQFILSSIKIFYSKDKEFYEKLKNLLDSYGWGWDHTEGKGGVIVCEIEGDEKDLENKFFNCLGIKNFINISVENKIATRHDAS